MKKFQRYTVAFCLLASASSLFGIAAKNSITWAPVIGCFLALIFTITAMVCAIRMMDGE